MRNYQNTAIADQLQSMELAFINAQKSSVLTAIKPYGYTRERLKELQQSLTEAKQLQSIQEKEYGEQYGSTNVFEERRTALNDLYMKHIKLARIELEDNIKASNILGILGRRKKAYAHWIEQVSRFYTQLEGDHTIAAQLESVNIHKKDIAQGIQLLAEVRRLKQEQNKEIAEAQQATEKRDKKLDELYKEYSRLIKIARIALDNDSQLLESLGIIVKR